MAIFSRRVLQRILDENSLFLSRNQIKSHLNALNRMHIEESVHAEWEIILLNAFSKIGKVLHENNFGGPRKGDLYFESPTAPKESFLADITTISDKGLDRMNPFQWLFGELMRTVEQHGFPSNLFRLEVGAHKIGSKLGLKIPGKKKSQGGIIP